jgi:hypothetical protein
MRISNISNIICAMVLSVVVGCVADQPPIDPDLASNTSMQQITSAHALDVYLRTTPSTPFDRLSSDAKQRFLSSLVFGDKGVGSFRYTDLEALSASEIADILRLFGVERTTSLIKDARVSTEADREVMRALPIGDHDGYWCSGRGTCSEQNGSICTSNC